VLPAERYERINRALQVAHVVSTEDLARSLAVSIETVRRDLVLLDKQGQLRRVHGGAASTSQDLLGEEPSFTDRSTGRHAAKAAIGRAAADLVRPGQTVVLDIGTTALEVARALPLSFRGTVATCSLLVAAELAGRPNVDVLVSGGRVRAGDLACSNSQALTFFSDLHADIAFLGTGGVSLDAGVTDFHIDEVATRRLILANSTLSFALAHAEKLGVTAPHRVCGLDALSGLITDGASDGAITDTISQAGGIVIAA
jgi:DeoR family fructose operon transcriptional repressor